MDSVLLFDKIKVAVPYTLSQNFISLYSAKMSGIIRQRTLQINVFTFITFFLFPFGLGKRQGLHTGVIC